MRGKTGDYLIIKKYLKSLRENGEGWVLAGSIRSIQTPFGWIGFRGDRNVRDLVEFGILERRKKGKYAEVRYKIAPPKTPEEEAREAEQRLIESLK